MHHFSSRWQAVGGEHHIHQRFDLNAFQFNRAISQFTVVIKQLFNQFLQITATGVEDLDDLFLLSG
ncbi:hypothetical protein D3C80_1197660 [compost metagenome]